MIDVPSARSTPGGSTPGGSTPGGSTPGGVARRSRKARREALAGCWWHGGGLEGSIAVAMVAGTTVLAGLPADGPLLLLAFCGTLLVYHLDRTPTLSPEDRANHPARWRWRCRHGALSGVLAGTAALGACWSLPHLHARTLEAGTLLAVPAVAYALPVFGSERSGGRRLKDVGLVKPFAVAAAWAAGSTVLPALEAGASLVEPSLGVPSLGVSLVLLAGYRFLFILPNVLFGDAADRRGDARAGLHTAATAWAPRRLRRLAAGALAVAVAGAAAALTVSGAPALLAVDLAGPVWLLVLVVAGLPSRPLSHAADCAMLWPAVTAALAWLM